MLWKKEFFKIKTLGAKKYCYHKFDKKKNKMNFGVTVSGLGKKQGAKELRCINNFVIGKTPIKCLALQGFPPSFDFSDIP